MAVAADRVRESAGYPYERTARRAPRPWGLGSFTAQTLLRALSLPRVPAASVSQRSGVGVRPFDRLTTGSREA